MKTSSRNMLYLDRCISATGSNELNLDLIHHNKEGIPLDTIYF